MPPRWLTALILTGWLTMTVLFVGWDLGPRLAPREPNLFPCKMTDEAGSQADSTGWTVLRDGREDYVANVDWEYRPRNDLFVSYCRLWCKHLDEPVPTGPRAAARNLGADTVFQVARNGRLARLDHHANYRLAWAGRPAGGPVASCLVRGTAHGRVLRTRVDVTREPPVPLGDEWALLKLDEDLGQPAEDAPLSDRGVLVSPLHPLRQVRDVRPGQTWRMTVLEPLGLARIVEHLDGQEPGSIPSAGVTPGLWHALDARCLDVLEWVNYREEDVACAIIEARAEQGPVTLLRLWVRPADGKVLRQEARVWDETWTFIRRPIEGRLIPLNPATAGSRS